MCGICGYFDSRNLIKENELIDSNNTLSHRGPNAGQTEVYKISNAGIGLGHKRLSILDLSPNGNQPMHSDDKSIIVILNGEIYNFKEIKNELIELGYNFRSTGDTEVIIKSYEEWGLKSVERFIGMFSFALLDKNKEELFLIRDRVGVKPLYYFKNENCLLFASELKALHPFSCFKKNINKGAVSLFFKYGYIPAPHTIFENTYKLPAGNILKLNIKNNAIEIEKYYDVFSFYNKPKIKIAENELIEKTEAILDSAFQYRMVSDVPVGVFLSGGYDSSTVAAMLQKSNTKKIKTFTIGFKDEKYNEAVHAKAIAKYIGTDHYEYYCSTKEAREIIPILPTIYDEPFGDTSSIPTILVSKFAREQVTVALSADGGDEIFAGYSKYDFFSKLHKKIRNIPGFLDKPTGFILNKIFTNSKIPGVKWSEKFQKFGDILMKENDFKRLEIMSQHFSHNYLSQMLIEYDDNIGLFDNLEFGNNENDFLNQMLALDYKTYLQDDILVKVDRATMSVSLEGREPLLDHRILELMATVPSDLKYKNGIKKYILKEITHKYIPEKLLNRPKTGFSIPIEQWLRHELKDLLMEYINENQLSKHNFMNIDKVIKIRDEFLEGENRHNTSIWLILTFQMWWEKWMEGH